MARPPYDRGKLYCIGRRELDQNKGRTVYQVIGMKNLLIAFAVITAGVAVWRLQVAPASSAWGYWPPLSLGLTVATTVILSLGQSPIFPLLCRIPGLRGIAPDI